MRSGVEVVDASIFDAWPWLPVLVCENNELPQQRAVEDACGCNREAGSQMVACCAVDLVRKSPRHRLEFGCPGGTVTARPGGVRPEMATRPWMHKLGVTQAEEGKVVPMWPGHPGELRLTCDDVSTEDHLQVETSPC